MRDDLSAPNLGQAKRDFDAEFFWQSYRIVEQWMSRVLSKGPLQVSGLTADEITVGKLTLAGTVVTLTDYVKKAGDTMTGLLTLSGTPTSGLHAATKTYADDRETAAKAYTDTQDALKVAKAGDTMTGNLNMTAHILPTTNGTYNLGSASLRWGTVYTSDLSLKNEHGDWTIVEGADDLFITNNRTGKRYRFALEEV